MNGGVGNIPYTPTNSTAFFVLAIDGRPLEHFENKIIIYPDVSWAEDI